MNNKSVSESEIKTTKANDVVVMFNFNGTLADSEVMQAGFYREGLLNAFAYNEEAANKVKALLPDNDKGIIWYMQNLMGRKLSEQHKIINAAFGEISNQEMDDLDAFVDTSVVSSLSLDSVSKKTVALLNDLAKQANVHTYVISGAGRNVLLDSLAATGLSGKINISNVFSGEFYDTSKRELFVELMDKHRVAPSDMVWVCGNPSDIKSAVGIGIYTIACIGNVPKTMFNARKQILTDAGASLVVPNQTAVLAVKKFVSEHQSNSFGNVIAAGNAVGKENAGRN